MQDKESRDALATPEGTSEKLPYEAPEFVRYGSLTELTQGGGTGGDDFNSPIP